MLILCCKCGIDIQPNEKNLCERCLSNETNLISHIHTNITLESCRGCERYHIPPKSWKEFAWGSQDLLIHCLRRNKSLKKLNIIDSNFIYSEEHSKRIFIEIKIKDGEIERECVLKYAIRNKQCSDCMRAESKQFWNSIVQLRQHPISQRTFFYLEQLILKHKAHAATSNIKERKEGIDFYFTNRTDALKMCKFLDNFYGTKRLESSRLISEDRNNNTSNSKSSFCVEILPFCKDDLVYIKDKSLGLGDFAIVQKVKTIISFFNPNSLRECKVTAGSYFNNTDNFKVLQKSENFVKFKVLMARRIDSIWTDVTVTNDDINIYELSTHLKLKENDTVLGYSLANQNFSEDVNFNREVILVRIFNDSERNWKLKTDRVLDDEYRLFLDDIENDLEMINSICLFDKKDQLIDDLAKMQISKNN